MRRKKRAGLSLSKGKTIFDPETVIHGSKFSTTTTFAKNNFQTEEEMSACPDEEEAVVPEEPRMARMRTELRMVSEVAQTKELEDHQRFLRMATEDPEVLLPSFFAAFLGNSPKYTLIRTRLPIEIFTVRQRQRTFTPANVPVWLLRMGLSCYQEYTIGGQYTCQVCGLSEKESFFYEDPAKTIGEKLERSLKFVKEDGAYAEFIRMYETPNQVQDFSDDLKHLLLNRMSSHMKQPTFDFEIGPPETAALLEIYLRVSIVFEHLAGGLRPILGYFTMNFDENSSVQ